MLMDIRPSGRGAGTHLALDEEQGLARGQLLGVDRHLLACKVHVMHKMQ